MANPPINEEAPVAPRCRSNAFESLSKLRNLLPGALAKSTIETDPTPIPTTPASRRRASSLAASLDRDEHLAEKISTQQEHGLSVKETEETVLYLAYGSNLASKTFRGVRGIKPLSQIGVFVPELRLTFDLPGIPYAEPCFAGTQYRHVTPTQDSDESKDLLESDGEELSEKATLLSPEVPGYHKRRWNKPLIGIVYEVTLTDYAKIIATEGGGRGYLDRVIDCHPFPDSYSPTDPVPDNPSTPPFKARTLLSPAADEARLRFQSHKTGSKVSRPKLSWWYTVGLHLRPDPDYAQPSARYLGLIQAGAEEHDLPVSYREYLAQVRTYHITTSRQKVGQMIFLILWFPWILLTMTLSKIFAGADGRSPAWLIALANILFSGMWNNYDCFFARVYGDGERTLDDIPA